jgi:hypothetical protein
MDMGGAVLLQKGVLIAGERAGMAVKAATKGIATRAHLAGGRVADLSDTGWKWIGHRL